MKNERDKLPACDRDWFLTNGLWLMNALGHGVTLDNENSEALRDLEMCKEISREMKKDDKE